MEQVKDIFAFEVKSEEKLKATGLIEIIGEEIDTAYINAVKTLEINPNCNKKDLKIVFSPLHGTANMPVRRVLTECGYEQLHIVEAQCNPDPNFSTVASPNPEETSAFEMAIQMAKDIDADIVMATDPDVDRVGLAVKNPEGSYVLLTGNQIGAILIHCL